MVQANAQQQAMQRLTNGGLADVNARNELWEYLKGFGIVRVRCGKEQVWCVRGVVRVRCGEGDVW